MAEPKTIRRAGGGVALKADAIVVPGASVGQVLKGVSDGEGGVEFLPGDDAEGAGATTLTFTGQTTKTFTPTSFPCFVELKGRAIGATGRWFGTINLHVPQASASYALADTDVDDLSQGFLDATTHALIGEAEITIDASTGAITITFPEAVTGRLSVTTV